MLKCLEFAKRGIDGKKGQEDRLRVDIVANEPQNLIYNRASQRIYHDIHTQSIEHMHMITAAIVYVIEPSEPSHSGGMNGKP